MRNGNNLHSVVVPAKWTGNGWITDVAFTYHITPGAGLSCSELQSEALSGGDKWYFNFDYPTSKSFLYELFSQAYVDERYVDLDGSPATYTFGVGWPRQPTGGDVGLGGIWANLHLPGTLYINMVLVANEGDSRWRIQSWDYNFEIDATVTDCLNVPPPCPNGNCQSPPPPPPPSPPKRDVRLWDTN